MKVLVALSVMIELVQMIAHLMVIVNKDIVLAKPDGLTRIVLLKIALEFVHIMVSVLMENVNVILVGEVKPAIEDILFLVMSNLEVLCNAEEDGLDLHVTIYFVYKIVAI
jgi:hypothetical protein